MKTIYLSLVVSTMVFSGAVALAQQPVHHVEAANNCQLAKDELNKAKTNDDIEQAVIKVRTLCED